MSQLERSTYRYNVPLDAAYDTPSRSPVPESSRATPLRAALQYDLSYSGRLLAAERHGLRRVLHASTAGCILRGERQGRRNLLLH